MIGEQPRGRTRGIRGGALIAAVAVLPPLVAVLVVLALRLTSESVEQPPVEIREEGRFVAYGTVDEALAAIEARSGFLVHLPTKLPNSNYRLIYVDSAVPANGTGKGPAVVIAYQDKRDRSGSWFWASQGQARSIEVPGALPEVRTAISDVTVWFVGGPAEPVGGNVRRMQFIARTTRYDRLISFEGPAFPDQGLAKRIIESILRVEEERERTGQQSRLR